MRETTGLGGQPLMCLVEIGGLVCRSVLCICSARFMLSYGVTS